MTCIKNEVEIPKNAENEKIAKMETSNTTTTTTTETNTTTQEKEKVPMTNIVDKFFKGKMRVTFVIYSFFKFAFFASF
jgi:hypothetical protein